VQVGVDAGFNQTGAAHGRRGAGDLGEPDVVLLDIGVLVGAQVVPDFG
jgi:hypothetical protein